MHTFDPEGRCTLTKSDIDQVLDRFDDTNIPLQREVFAAVCGYLQDARLILEDVRREAGNRAPEVRRKYLPASIRARIDEFLSRT